MSSGPAAALLPLLLLFVAATSLSGCPEHRGDRPARVSTDPNVQLRFEQARQLLADIEHRRLIGQEIYGDCKMARVLFVRELRALPAPAAQRVAQKLVGTCAGAAAAAEERVGY